MLLQPRFLHLSRNRSELLDLILDPSSLHMSSSRDQTVASFDSKLFTLDLCRVLDITERTVDADSFTFV